MLYTRLLENEIQQLFDKIMEQVGYEHPEYGTYTQLKLKDTFSKIERVMDVYGKVDFLLTLQRLLDEADAIYNKEVKEYVAKMEFYEKQAKNKEILEKARKFGYSYYGTVVSYRNVCDACTTLSYSKTHIDHAKLGVNIPPLHLNCECDLYLFDPDYADMSNVKTKVPDKGKLVEILKQGMPIIDILEYYYKDVIKDMEAASVGLEGS